MVTNIGILVGHSGLLCQGFSIKFSQRLCRTDQLEIKNQNQSKYL